MPTVDELPAVY